MRDNWWFENVSSDCDRPIAPALLMQGHWRHRLHPFAEPVLCRVVIDVAEPRVVAAQVIEDGIPDELGGSALEDLSQVLAASEVHLHASAWGFAPIDMLPEWARPSFSEKQIEELERIEGYLIDASSDETVDTALKLLDEFLRGIGMTDRDVHRAVREPKPGRKCGRVRVS